MRDDPPPNDDRTCALPDCTKILPARAAEDGDPFHSNTCCHEWHGVVLTGAEARPVKPAKSYTSRKDATAPS